MGSWMICWRNKTESFYCIKLLMLYFSFLTAQKVLSLFVPIWRLILQMSGYWSSHGMCHLHIIIFHSHFTCCFFLIIIAPCRTVILYLLFFIRKMRAQKQGYFTLVCNSPFIQWTSHNTSFDKLIYVFLR